MKIATKTACTYCATEMKDGLIHAAAETDPQSAMLREGSWPQGTIWRMGPWAGHVQDRQVLRDRKWISVYLEWWRGAGGRGGGTRFLSRVMKMF